MSHSFHIFNVDNFSVLEWMLGSIEKSNKTIFSTGDTLDDDLGWFFSIFIENLKLITKVIEDSAMGTSEISADEFDVVGSALFI